VAWCGGRNEIQADLSASEEGKSSAAAASQLERVDFQHESEAITGSLPDLGKTPSIPY
jgi:hypothetical protein